MQKTLPGSTLAIMLAAGTSLSMAQPCAEWLRDIGIPGAGGHPEPTVYGVGIHNGEIYAGGNFTEMGATPANRIARFDGSHWSALDPVGIGATNFNFPEVRAIESFNGAVYVGGRFETAGGQPASRIARWDGELWHPLGGGVNSPASHVTIPQVWDLLVWDDGSGPALFIAGEFTHADGAVVNHIARWNGTSLSGVGGGLPGARYSLAGFQGHLYAGGGPSNNSIHRWDGSSWSPPPGVSVGGPIEALGVVDDGSGAALYIAVWGSVHKYDGAATTNITGNLFAGGSFIDSVHAFAGFDDGSGPALYAGGYFNARNNIVRLSGTEWITVDGGVTGPSQPYISELLNHGDELILAGRFATAGGEPASSIVSYGCPDTCYANCDGSTSEPILTVDDFTCFINEFAAAQGLPHEQQVAHYANCDGSTTAPALTVDDFTCFINEFAAGCP